MSYPNGIPDPEKGPDLTKRDGSASAETSHFGSTPAGWSQIPAAGEGNPAQAGSPEQFAPTQFGVPTPFGTPTPAPENLYGTPGAYPAPGAAASYGAGQQEAGQYGASQYGAYGTPGYGVPPYGYGVQPTSNGKAIGSLVCGIIAILGLSFCAGGLVGIVAVILGPQAKREIAASGGTQTGAGMATAGIVLGWISLALTAALVVFLMVVGALG